MPPRSTPVIVVPTAPATQVPPPEPAPETTRKRRRLLNKKTAIGLGIVICLITGLMIYRSMNSNSNATSKKPTYQTLLPQGKTIHELGGWKRVSPPEDQPVFAFTDAVDGIPVSVTEQPLPQQFKNNIDSQVADLAKKFNATDKIDANGTPVYIGTSVKGPQSAIFATKKLLILIKSEKKISDTSWTSYVVSLTN